jgi:alpha-mannosidase
MYDNSDSGPSEGAFLSATRTNDLSLPVGPIAFGGVFLRQVFCRLRSVALCPVIAFFLLCCHGTADAQAVLDPQAAQAVKRLSSLNSLPLAGWRYHTGDVPHGEAADLDDSQWQSASGPAEVGNEAVWFRCVVEVPKTLNGYDLSGARVWFKFNAGANGPIPQIIYFNGRRVAMGEDLEPIVLFDGAKPGDRVVVAVKLLHTVDVKKFSDAEAKIDFVASRPSPSDLVDEVNSAAILLPSIESDPAGSERQLNSAVAQIDLGALDKADQPAFDASLRKAQAQLEVLRPVLEKVAIKLTGNSHIDAAWLWPWTETVDVTRRTLGTALQLMHEYPKYTYTQSAAAYSEWICDKYPSECQEIKDRVKEGRWEMVGGMWVEPDLNMPDGESLVRQLLIGKRYFKEQFGVDVRIGWNPDSFGYTWQLPQIYKKSGVDYFVTQKMHWNDTNQLPLKLFWWESPDGSRVLSYFPNDYVNPIEPVPMAEQLAKARTMNPGLPETMHLYGIGDHGGGPTRAMLDAGDRWTSPDVVYPRTTFGVAQSYFNDVEGKLDTEHAPVWNYAALAAGKGTLSPAADGKVSLPVWKDELYFEYHRGVYTTQANHKRNMRDSEEWLLNAEKFSSLAWLQGLDYPQVPLNEAWKKVLFNQFHDLGAGSGIGIIYKDAQKDYDIVHWTANDAEGNAWKALSAKIDTSTIKGKSFAPGTTAAVLVANPLAWSRSDVVEADVQLPAAASGGLTVVGADGLVLKSQVLSEDRKTHSAHVLIKTRDVPSLGYQVLHVSPEAKVGITPNSSLKASGTTLENNLVRVTVDPKSGCITSLFDKKANFETIAAGGCGNQLQTFKDTPKDYDAWNVDPGTYDHYTSLDNADSVELVDKGPLRASVRVTHIWQSSKFVQDIVLTDDSPEVQIVNDIDWHETHVLLKASFPLAATSDKATFEIPYGSIERATTRNNSFEKARFEVPAMRWADLGDGQHGFSLINESKYGYDAVGNQLRLTLLRSPTWPDPDADRGHHHFSFWLYPHAADWKAAMTVRRGYETNYPLTATQVEPHTGEWPSEHSFVGVAADNVVLTAVKKAEDSNALLFRVYEWAGKSGDVTISVPSGATGATLVNLMEQPEGSAIGVSGDKVSFPITPFAIQTVRVDYPHASSK